MYLQCTAGQFYFLSDIELLILPAGSLNEFPLVVEHSTLANFVDNLEVVVLGLGLELGCPVDVGLALYWVLVFQVQPEKCWKYNTNIISLK